MNDIILSGLLNLFALFGALSGIDREKASRIIAAYLSQHFGVHSLETYLGLYNDLRDLYDESPSLDKDRIIAGICDGLRKKILAEEQVLLLLRFMEFSAMNQTRLMENRDIFVNVAQQFGVSEAELNNFLAFVTDGTTERVVSVKMDGLDGEIRLLELPEFNKLVFSYRGKDVVLMNDVPVLAGAFQVWQQSGVLKSARCAPLYFSSAKAKFTVQTDSTAIELAGRDINFRFPNSDNGMHNLSFTLHSGELVAIMGGSGVGKSTLLGLLNGNIKPQEGQILLNGYSIEQPDVQKLVGFVPQDDLLIEELTVYQNLWYTARLCFDGMDAQELDKRVNDVLTDLGLLASKDLKVGSALNKTISGGQRKRLNIALELIREPAVLFLDEPTSGLSSTDSEKVINLLKEQTYRGRLIVVNIHQPSSDIYKLFDRLWLLDRGGYPVYDGNPIEAITYFKKAVHYADADASMCALCGNVNPEVVLNIIDAKSLNDSGQLTEERKVSPQEWHAQYLDSRPDQPAVEKKVIPESKQKKPNAYKQFLIFLERNIRTKITDTQYLLITFLEAPLLALIVAFLTKFAPETGYTLFDNKNLVSFFFMAVIVSIFIGMSISAEEIFKDRSLLKRERFLRLSHGSYIWSKMIYLMALSLIQTFLFIIVGNVVMGIHGMFFIWWIILFASAFVANLTGLVLSQSLGSIVAIYITIPLLLIPQIMLCGLVVKFDDLSAKSDTGNVPVIGDFIPSRWAFEALAVSSFEYNDYMDHFFELEKEKFKAQYYNIGLLNELQSQLEQANKEHLEGKEVAPEHMLILAKNIPTLAKVTESEPFTGDMSNGWKAGLYDELDAYFLNIDNYLNKRSTFYTRAIDKVNTDFLQEKGKEYLLALKKDNYNQFLADMVTNSATQTLFKVSNNVILPKVGQIYLDPLTTNGRAPFYSHVKILGKHRIPTLWYNLGILAVMAILTALALFFEIPSRLLRKKD